MIEFFGRFDLLALAFHLGVPATLLATFLWLDRRMRRSGVPEPPRVAAFVCFVCYGGWLMVLLTDAFGWWSGAASLGAFVLLFLAPVVMIAFAIELAARRWLSRYHGAVFVACAAYTPLVLLSVSATRSLSA